MQIDCDFAGQQGFSNKYPVFLEFSLIILAKGKWRRQREIVRRGNNPGR